jgi:signal transduction histidine kinase
MDQAATEGKQGPHPSEATQNGPEDLTATVRELRETLEAKVAERTAALQAANTELLKSSRAKSEFMARVSHDLRQPLNAVVGFTDLLLLQGGESLSSSQRRYLGHVVTATQ